MVIPVYNAARFLNRTVRSALQRREVVEVILVEDGSTDNSLAVCNALLEQDVRIRLYNHPNGANKGAGASRNVGISKASAPFIAFLDADDYFLENRFVKDKEVFQSIPEADGVYNAIGVDYDSPEAKEQFQIRFNVPDERMDNYLTTVNAPLDPKDLFKGLWGFEGQNAGYFSLDGLTLKASAINKLDGLFQEELRLHQDTEFNYRCAYYLNLYPGSIDRAVSNRLVHASNRITADKSAQVQAAKRFKFLSFVYDWAKKEGLPKAQMQHIYLLKAYNDLKQRKQPIRYFRFLTYLFSGNGIIRNPVSDRIHRSLFNNRTLSWMHCKGVAVLRKLLGNG